MKDMSVEDFSNEVFELSENTIYKVLEKFNEKQNVDKTLTYIFIKAFYLHVVKMALARQSVNIEFEKVYSNYRMYLSMYYKSNNSQIDQELLNQILDAFDKSFEIVESLDFSDLEDSYEFRHHIVDSFELLRKILEKKSKCDIRTDIFEEYITDIQEQSEKIVEFIEK